MIDDGHLNDYNIYESTENIHKYPLMRRMFHDPDNPINTSYVMWFDDDSYLRTDECRHYETWLDDINDFMKRYAMLGAVYTKRIEGNQVAFIEDQPWYNGKSVEDPIKFITGGWWCLRTEIITLFDWPVSALDHRGGDVLLGELLRQQNGRMKSFNQHVAINADENGRQCKSPKRGYDSRPIGHDYDPGVTKQIAKVLPRLDKKRLPYERLME
tara:strand:+ start:35995 stop:36633 length:639 start_codon:yes stop_codon:yes gene_type:complete